MKKFLKSAAVVFLLMHIALTFNIMVAFAQSQPPAPTPPATPPASETSKDTPKPVGTFLPIEQIMKIGEKTGLPDFVNKGQHSEAPPDYGSPGIGAATSPILFAIDAFRFVVSGIAVLIVVIAAINLVSTASDEEATKAKDTLLMGILGLLVIQIADVAVNKMFFGQQGEAFEDVTSAQLFGEETTRQVRGIIGFLEAFVGAVAVLVIVIRGFMLITAYGEEEEITKTKRHIIYALVGLAAVAVSEVVVRGVIFPAAGTELPNVERGKFILVELTNYIAGFVGLLSFVVLFYGGYKYVVSAGDEEETNNVKKIITASFIALILTLGAFAIVNSLVKYEPVNTIDTGTESPSVTDTLPPT